MRERLINYIENLPLGPFEVTEWISVERVVKKENREAFVSTLISLIQEQAFKPFDVVFRDNDLKEFRKFKSYAWKKPSKVQSAG